ncbi:hypothetical protein CBEVV_010 [Choristoneura biennis entomopoxvirus 'L' virophage]|nr:hypothetical protein CBEVV_010 [Choristoneura biennis entomopoxvirus 'L' virophage]
MICKRCNIEKNIDHFYSFNRSVCKECRIKYNSDKIKCGCGKEYTRTNKNRHLSSRFHNYYVDRPIHLCFTKCKNAKMLES